MVGMTILIAVVSRNKSGLVGDEMGGASGVYQDMAKRLALKLGLPNTNSYARSVDFVAGNRWHILSRSMRNVDDCIWLVRTETLQVTVNIKKLLNRAGDDTFLEGWPTQGA